MSNLKTIYSQVSGHNWHLRPEYNYSQLTGILIINGVKVLYLNPSAYYYVHTFLFSKLNHKLTILRAAFHFGISPKKARQDWNRLYSDLLQTSAGCCEGSGIEFLSPDLDRNLSAPLRVDLALTYRCNNDCIHCYAGGNRETEELSSKEWSKVIDKLHLFGVPQVIFTGGESLLRPDLEELINHAKKKNMITGLITNGRLLTHDRVVSLVRAGLDFVQITVESIDHQIHNQMVGTEALAETLSGVQNALNSSLRVTTNTTITQINVDSVLPTLAYLIGLGVQRVGVNGIIRANRGVSADGLNHQVMEDILLQIQELCNLKSTEMLWFTPTCYQHLNALTLGLGVKRCSAASIVLTVEPTGQVIPCQSYFSGLGDARYDSMDEIWNHPLAVSIRERHWVRDNCRSCANFDVCGGSCPLEIS